MNFKLGSESRGSISQFSHDLLTDWSIYFISNSVVPESNSIFYVHSLTLFFLSVLWLRDFYMVVSFFRYRLEFLRGNIENNNKMWRVCCVIWLDLAWFNFTQLKHLFNGKVITWQSPELFVPLHTSSLQFEV